MGRIFLLIALTVVLAAGVGAYAIATFGRTTSHGSDRLRAVAYTAELYVLLACS
jgi:hypothetical protein